MDKISMFFWIGGQVGMLFQVGSGHGQVWQPRPFCPPIQTIFWHKHPPNPSSSLSTLLLTVKFTFSSILQLMKVTVLTESSSFSFCSQAYQCFTTVSRPFSGMCCTFLSFLFHFSRITFYYYDLCT
jgi:hypothetical protein